MNVLDHLEIKNGYASFHPAGKSSFAECANLVSGAIRLACDQGVEKLLVNIAALTGFEPPTTVPRFFFAELLAAEATQPIKFALVCCPDFIRGNHYGVMIAENRGLLCNVFPSEPEALKWLLDPNIK